MINIVMIQDDKGGDGTTWRAGNTYSCGDSYAKFLIGKGSAYAADGALPDVQAIWDGTTAPFSLLQPDGSVAMVSEAQAVQTLTATGTAFSGACEFRGFVVRAETGGTADVTVYDATSATGTAIMTVSNISVGTYYWDGDWATAGVGNGARRINSTGCHVVIAGTCTIDVMVA